MIMKIEKEFVEELKKRLPEEVGVWNDKVTELVTFIANQNQQTATKFTLDTILCLLAIWPKEAQINILELVNEANEFTNFGNSVWDVTTKIMDRLKKK